MTSPAFSDRVTRALAEHADAFAGALSLKAGFQVIARIFAGALGVDSLVLTLVSPFPAFTLHAQVRSGAVRLVDSRERDFDRLVPSGIDRPADWSFVREGRFTLEVRTSDLSLDDASLQLLAALVSPFLELTRRMERILRASTLLDVAVDPKITRHSETVFSEIVRRIGRTIDHPAAIYIDDAGEDQRAPGMYVFEGSLAPQAANHIFASIAQVPNGPVAIAHSSPALAAPTTMRSMDVSPAGVTANNLIRHLYVSDYVAIRLAYHDDIVGTLVVVAMDGKQLTSDEEAMTASLAWASSLAIPIAQQQRTIRRRLQESELLRHIASVGYRNGNETETHKMAANVARVIFGADYVAIGTIRLNDFVISFDHVSGSAGNGHVPPPRPLQDERVQEWAQAPYPYVISSESIANAIMANEFLMHRAEGLVTSMAAATRVASRDRTYFLLTGFRREQDFDEEELHFANALIQTIAAAM